MLFLQQKLPDFIELLKKKNLPFVIVQIIISLCFLYPKWQRGICNLSLLLFSEMFDPESLHPISIMT